MQKLRISANQHGNRLKSGESQRFMGVGEFGMPPEIRSDHTVQRLSLRTPGVLTLLEALFWTAGFLAAQAMILVMLLAILIVSSFGWNWPGQDETLKWVLETNLDRSFLLVGTPVLGAVFLLLPLIRWREGRDFRKRIGWRYPTADEFVISLATVCPIALLGNLVYEQVNLWCQGEPLVVWPSATALHQTSLDHLYSTFQGVPFPVLIVTMALAPAFAEELIFRGMLGRRLVAQFGVIPGILLASMAFAMIHGSLPHAVATFPVAILLHLLYLQTGTIWVPVLVHFSNNLLAVTMVHYQLQPELAHSPMLLGSLSIYLVMMLLLLSSRTRTMRGVGANAGLREISAIPGS